MGIQQQLLARIDRLDTLSRRDRLSLAFGLLALLVGVELMLIEPTGTKRRQIEQSLSADTSSQIEARALAAAEQAAQLVASRARNTQLQASLAALGLKDGMNAGQHESLAAFLAHSLRPRNVVLVATRGLPVEPVNLAAAADDGSAAVAAAGPASGADAAPALFRHRTELTLEGTVPDLAEAIELMERELAPLRIERVRLAPRGVGGAVQASVVLTTINQERTWLAL